MAISKVTKRARPMLDYENKTIKRLSDILQNYSHTKLKDLYGNKNIGRIYKYFIENCLDKSFNQYPEYKRIIYKKAAMDIAQGFKYNY